jgi:hypothetical protein
MKTIAILWGVGSLAVAGLLGWAQAAPGQTENQPANEAAVRNLPRRKVLPRLQLPFVAGQAWEVIQGNKDLQGSHRGYAAYCWDFILASNPTNQARTKGVVFHAAAPGRVVLVEERFDSGAGSNVIVTRLADGQYLSYLHLQQGSFSKVFRKGQFLNQGLGLVPQALSWDERPQVVAGEPLAGTGDTGARVGAYHLHFAVTNRPDRGEFHPFRTVPVAFSDYFASDDRGKSWYFVRLGVPTRGQWVKRGTAPANQVGKVGPLDVDPLTMPSQLAGTIALAPGSGQPAGNGKWVVTVTAPWGEPLRTTTVVVTKGKNDQGPWSYQVHDILPDTKVLVTARFEGPWSVAADGGVRVSQGPVVLKSGETRTVNLTYGPG